LVHVLIALLFHMIMF